MPDLLVLARDELDAALPMARAIEAMRETFEALGRERVRQPLRASIDIPERRATTLLMGASAPGSLGAKIVSVFPDNVGLGFPGVQALVVLLDPETGRPLALLEGGRLTALRTGAASGLATDLLARPEARRVAILGSGTQARTQLEAVCTVREIAEVVVYSRTRSHANRFAAEMGGRGAVPDAIRVASSAADAVRDADVVCAATSADTPVLWRRDVPRGCHVNAVGSFRPRMLEIDPELLGVARVVVDQREAALAEAGEVIAALERALLDEDELTELGALLVAETGARDSERQITLFKSVGLAVQDVVAARVAVTRAREAGLGRSIEI